jgi:hypothetical protein
MKRKLLSIMIMGVLVFSAGSVMSQPPPAPPPGSESGPIDSGSSILLLGIVCYGYVQLKKKEVA